MNIKKGDKVKIICGKDRGKSGKVLQVFPEKRRISVEGLNLLIKHMRPRRQGEKGQRIEFPAMMNISNVMLVCPECARPTMVGHKKVVIAEGKREKKYRQCLKCKQTFA